MYKVLLCWRYLRTRYIALASIISVTLGVATMIVVNSVMSGFATEMKNRIHGILSDVVLEVRSLSGVPDAAWHMAEIRRVAGDAIEGMTAIVAVPAMLNFRYGDQWITKQVQLIGIDETTQSRVSDFSKYLQHPENRRKMSFQLREGGYDVHDHQTGPEAGDRPQMKGAGWERRRLMAEEAFNRRMSERAPMPATGVPGSGGDANPAEIRDPFSGRPKTPEPEFDPAKEQHTGVVLGIVMAGSRLPTGEEKFHVLPGDDVKLAVPTAGKPRGLFRPDIAGDDFTIVDFYECKMAEYDSSFVFVPIRKLQEMRGMIDPNITDPATGKPMGLFNSIQIKLKPGYDGDEIRNKLAATFDPHLYVPLTWRDKQGPLLAAVQMESAILNVLLFLIIAVSGFGILAIFFMIVVEKTRDIGVLKSLGASGSGIMGIFLSYGLSLGAVGSGVGLALGLFFVRHINDIAALLGKITGRPVFDPSIYYFYRIPTIVDPWTITWIVLGALAIAVLASVLPALRAALLRPVEALRYE